MRLCLCARLRHVCALPLELQECHSTRGAAAAAALCLRLIPCVHARSFPALYVDQVRQIPRVGQARRRHCYSWCVGVRGCALVGCEVCNELKGLAFDQLAGHLFDEVEGLARLSICKVEG